MVKCLMIKILQIKENVFDRNSIVLNLDKLENIKYQKIKSWNKNKIKYDYKEKNIASNLLHPFTISNSIYILFTY